MDSSAAESELIFCVRKITSVINKKAINRFKETISIKPNWFSDFSFSSDNSFSEFLFKELVVFKSISVAGSIVIGFVILYIK